MFKKISWSFISTISNLLFQFLGLIILSKLISPEEYGIVGVMFFFINIADMLVDSGMGGALIYKKDPSEVDFFTLFVYNLVVSLVLYFALFISSGIIASFYEIPQLRSYIRVYGLIVVIIALCITQDCKLRKKMDFKTLAIISIVSNTISLSIAIWGASKGFGVWALILQALVFQIVRAISLYMVCGISKVLRFSMDSFKSQFSFGGWLFLANVIQSICSNIYSNIIPKIGNLSQTGFYTQSVKIGSVPTNTVNLTIGAVVFPYLTTTKDEKELVAVSRGYFRKVYHISFPMLTLLSVISYEIILIVLGYKWIQAAPYLAIILLSGLGDMVSFMLRTMLKSDGRTKIIMRLELIKSIIKISFVILSIPLGMKFLILSIFVASVINMFVSFWGVVKNTLYDIKSIIKDLLPPLSLSVLVAGFAYALISFIGHSYGNLVIVVFAYLMYFVIGILLKNTDILEIKEFVFSKIKR